MTKKPFTFRLLPFTLTLLFAFYLSSSSAQEYVFDPQYFASVMANQGARSSAESAHNQYLGKINTNINNINTNVGSVVLAQEIIYLALANVNSALKDGLEVKNMSFMVSDIVSYLSQALTMAKSQPALLLVAERIEREMGIKAAGLVTDVSGFVLKEGDNMLADYSVRDELFHKVILKLQILDGLAYGAWKAMYWAKENGIFNTLNPFAAYINKDKIFVQQIISNAKYLKQ